MSLTTLTTNATTDIITEELKDNLIPDKSTSIAEYSEEYGNSTIANETFFDSFSPQISSISSTEHHIVTVAVGCTVAVLLAAFLIGLLTYHLAKKKVVSPAQMVTFYYEEGPYAEIESDKWQNIVSLCTTMEDVEAEIHRSMAHLYAASSICSSAYEGVHKSISAGNMLKHEYDNVYENNTVERSKKLKRLKNLRLKPLGYKTSSSASNIRYNSEDVIGDKTVTKSLFDELQEVKALEEGIYEDTKSFSSGSYASVDRKNPYDSVCGGSRKSNSLNSNCKTSPLTTLAEVHQTTPEQSQIPEENSCKHCSNLKRVPIVRSESKI